MFSEKLNFREFGRWSGRALVGDLREPRMIARILRTVNISGQRRKSPHSSRGNAPNHDHEFNLQLNVQPICVQRTLSDVGGKNSSGQLVCGDSPDRMHQMHPIGH